MRETVTPANIRATIDLLERSIALLEEKGMGNKMPTDPGDAACALIMKFWADQPPDVQKAIMPYLTLRIAEELLATGQLSTLYREKPTMVGFYRAFIDHARLKLLELEFAS